MAFSFRYFSIPTEILTLSIGLTLSAKFESMEYKSGLMFKELSIARPSYNGFKLVYRTNLTEFFLITEQIENCSIMIDHLCVPGNSLCLERKLYINKIIQLVKRTEKEISIYRNSATKTHSRSRRSFEFFGQIIDWFGSILDSKSAQEYDEKFNEVYQDSQRIRQLNLDTTTFAKENIILSGKKCTELADSYNKMEEQLFNHHSAVERNELLDKIERLANAWFLEHQFLSEQITKHLEGAIFGKFSQLIPIEQLTQDLGELELLLPDKQKLPINLGHENALNIFKFTATRATLYGNKMLIEISIPKVEIEVYTAYEIIPIPFKIGNVSAIILPSMTQFLFNHDTADYIPIQKIEYDSSITNSAGERIIKPRDNIFHDFQHNCEMNIFMNSSIVESSNLCNIKVIPNSNLFIPLNYINEYYLSIQSSVILHKFCFRKPLSKREISTSGILTLYENCRIRTKEITIRPRISSTIYSGKIISLMDFNNVSLSVISDQLQNFSIFNEKKEKNIPQILIRDYLEDFTDLR